MILYLIQILGIVLCFVLIFANHRRIDKIQFNNERLLLDTKQQINALNTVLLQKYEKKQNIDSKIMKLIVEKVNKLTANVNSTDNSLISEVADLKSNIRYLTDQKVMFYEFDEESS
jgi:signal transduction histidine kinase